MSRTLRSSPCKMLVILVNGSTRFYVQRNVLRTCPFLTAGISPDLVLRKFILPRSGLSLRTRGEFTVSLPWHHAVMSRFNRVEIAEGQSLVDLLSETGLWYKKLISQWQVSGNKGSMHAVHLDFFIVFVFVLLGKDAVCKSLKTNADVKKIVSEKVEYHWKTLARELGLTDGRIDAISEDEQDICGECCYKVLQKWCEENGEMATIRRVMVALTRIGLVDINNDIVDCLNLRRLDQMELESENW